MIYTGYYSKIKEYKSAGLTTVSISRTQPKSVQTDGKILELSPDYNTLWEHKNNLITTEEYERRYLAQLEKLGIRTILLKIHSFGNNVVLLCWESPEKFCHRHLLADYINKNSKLHLEEYKI